MNLINIIYILAAFIMIIAGVSLSNKQPEKYAGIKGGEIIAIKSMQAWRDQLKAMLKDDKLKSWEMVRSLTNREIVDYYATIYNVKIERI